jgi:ribonuclease P protein subunit RPR2
MAPITISQKKMAKMKSKGTGAIPSKAMHSRASFLYQTAIYLATQQQQRSKPAVESSTSDGSYVKGHGTKDMAKPEMQATFDREALLQAASRRLISDLRAVSLKAQMRMSPTMKHAICKNCDTILVDGSTCASKVENKSKGGKKPWADILVRRCNICGTARRFPVAAERQNRRTRRSTQDPGNTQEFKAAER